MITGFIRRALNQLLARITYFLATFGTRSRNFIEQFISRKTERYELSRTVLVDQKPVTKLAILALFPRSPLRLSINRLCTALTNNGYHIIAVINESSDKNETSLWLTDLTNFNATVIQRPNIGRDFAAFRTGYRYLEKHGLLNSAERLIFANDSCYYGTKSIAFISRLLSEPADLQGITVNYVAEFHVQSFFIVFSQKIFNTEWFSSYWRKYRISDLRHLTIRRGEIALSVLCREHGFTPRGFITAERILQDDNFKGFTEDEEAAIWRESGLVDYLSSRGSAESTILFKRQFLERSTAHHHGLVASRVLGAPLKLDLFKSGLASNEGLRQSICAMGAEASECEALIDYMNRDGSEASIWGIRRLWRSTGLI